MLFGIRPATVSRLSRAIRLARARTVTLLLCLLLASTIFFLAWRHFMRHNAVKFVVFSPSDRSDNADGNEENTPPILQEMICPKGSDQCFKVEDYIWREWQEDNRTRRLYQRRLMDQLEANVVLSVADLLPDEPDAPFLAQNAIGWTVRKNSLSLIYIKAMVAQMFVSGCVQLKQREHPSRTLMVGLGGASVPNFLAEIDPSHQVLSVELEPAVEYIARKWFALKQSPRQKVVVRDGVQFISEWSIDSGGTFDCLIIDACGTKSPSPGHKYPLICPAEGFVNPEQMVKKLFTMLRSEGILLINTFFVPNGENESKVAEGRQFLLELFKHHFGGHCYYIGLAQMFSNKILVCTLARSAAEPMTDRLFNDRLGKLPNWLREELSFEMTIENEFLAWRHFMRHNAVKFVVFSPSDRSDNADGNEENTPLILQEMICPKGSDQCFKVEDYIWREWQEDNRTRRLYQRRLMDQLEANVVLSVADLLPDEPDAPFLAQNAIGWTVRKNSLSLIYIKAMVAQMFVSGCVQLKQREHPSRTLMVGLGGASVPNFLAEIDPSHQVLSVELEPAVEYIARKWFALKQSPRQKVVVRDGVQFISEWSTDSDGLFNCIFIDACKITNIASGQDRPMLCPFFEAFVDHGQLLPKIVKMLQPDGTFIANFFAKNELNESKVAEGRQFLLELFKHHFGGHCYYIGLAQTFSNKILVCTLARSAAEPMTDRLFNDRLGKLPNWLREELSFEMTIENEVWRRRPNTHI